jgi:hypothetical protein
MKVTPAIRNWAQFDRRIRYRDTKLLERLSNFENAVLVAGCQRSGTTAVTRILREALEMPLLEITKDDELDAALVLSGAVDFSTEARCCFQTTYINDHVEEYFEHDNYKLIWVIRRPDAIVRSMLLNWRRGALKRLFRACGRHALDDEGIARFNRYGTFGFSRLDMACLSYNIKTAQVHELAARLGPDRLYLVDYDDLIDKSDMLLPAIFSFASIPYHDYFLDRLQKRNRPKGEHLDEGARKRVVELCEGEYQRAVELLRKCKQ